jgi:glucose dehydrogenase
MFLNKLIARDLLNFTKLCFALFLLGIMLVAWSMWYSGFSFFELLHSSANDMIIWVPGVLGIVLSCMMLIVFVVILYLSKVYQ